MTVLIIAVHLELKSGHLSAISIGSRRRSWMRISPWVLGLSHLKPATDPAHLPENMVQPHAFRSSLNISMPSRPLTRDPTQTMGQASSIVPLQEIPILWSRTTHHFQDTTHSSLPNVGLFRLTTSQTPAEYATGGSEGTRLSDLQLYSDLVNINLQECSPDTSAGEDSGRTGNPETDFSMIVTKEGYLPNHPAYLPDH